MKTNNSTVVVTALGMSSPKGNSSELFLRNYEEGNNSSKFSHIIDEKLENDLALFSNVNSRRMDRLTKITMMAAVTCLEDANINLDETNINDIGGIFCSSYGPIASARDFIKSGFRLGLEAASPLIFPYTVINSAPGAITVLMKARGFSTTVQGYNPLAYAFDVINNKKAKAILAGGFDELSPEMEQAYQTRAVENGNGSKVPSEIENISEGAAMLFVEEEEFANERNSKILFKILGYSVNSNLQFEEKSIDNFGYIAPDCISKTMTNALKRSNLDASKINLIMSLAREDSNQVNSEWIAIDDVWGDAEIPKIHYPKIQMGETLGASDSFAAILGYFKGLELKNEMTEPIYVMVNSYHIGGNCFSVIIEL